MGNSLQFGGFRLDLDRMCLVGPKGRVDLRPKSFEVLRYLVEHAERVVSKDELIEVIWQNVIVTEDLLTHCISEVRRAMGADAQALIKTVSKRGYMLDVPVQPAAPAPAPPSMLEEPAISRLDKQEAVEEAVGSPLDVGGRKQATAVHVEISRNSCSVRRTRLRGIT